MKTRGLTSTASIPSNGYAIDQRLPRSTQAGTDKLSFMSSSLSWLPLPMTAWYIFKKARGRSRDPSPDTSPPPSGLPRTDILVSAVDGGIHGEAEEGPT